MGIAFLFPGQGAQFVGMGKDLYDNIPIAKEIFDRADEILGFKISELCFNGPAEKLNATDIQQPAIFVTSAACLEAMKTSEKYQNIKPDYMGGLSLGEYTAYYAADTLDFESALKLVRARGEYMQQASETSDGAMISIIGLSDDEVIKICEQAKENDILVPANFNCPGQVVLSGHKSACKRAEKLAEQAGAMNVVTLDVAGAFHSPLMQPAADKLNQILNNTEFKPPKIPVISNIDAKFYTEPDEIRKALSKQLTSSTYWNKCMKTLIEKGVNEFYEIGPKRTLTGFLKRIDRKLKPTTIGGLQDIR